MEQSKKKRIEVRQVNNQRNFSHSITVGRFAEELYGEIARIGYIDRLGKINQLGAIQVSKRHKRTKLDYINLQLYIHEIIGSKEAEIAYKYSYSSDIKDGEYRKYKIEKKCPSVLDIIQMLVLLTNIGHFNNTFATNIGILEALRTDKELLNEFIFLFKSEEEKQIVNQFIQENNYKQIHLAIAMLILDECNQNLPSVAVAKLLIRDFIHKTKNEKIHSAIEIFKNARNLAYYVYDLPVSPMPLQINIKSENDIRTLFKELQDKYNDNTYSKNLIETMGRLLSVSLYNNSIDVIQQYHSISKRITKKLRSREVQINEILADLLCKDSIYNKSYPKTQKFDSENILKLTFTENELDFEKSFLKVQKLKGVYGGYYYRYDGRKTMILALKKDANIKDAFRVLRELISIIGSISSDKKDKLVGNITRFFLFYVFDRHLTEIIPIKGLDVFMVKGRLDGIGKISKAVPDSDDKQGKGGEAAEAHELHVIKNYLSSDLKTDRVIVVCGSVKAKKSKTEKSEKNNHNELNEYDGLLIYPNRKEEQVVFFEAKNKTQNKRSDSAEKCLKDKFDNIKLFYDEDKFVKEKMDCYYKYTV